jgi:uncharacterized membrane protein YphA (DoxX/SURF4 family)
MVMLVLLRLAIGWHFFKEGVSHYTDPTWSSEGFLHQARGPLADEYKAMLPEFHGWDRMMLAPLADNKPQAGDEQAEDAAEANESKPKAEAKAADETKPGTKEAAEKSEKAVAKKHSQTPAYEAWLKQAIADWRADADRAAEKYHFDETQKAKADALVDEFANRIELGWVDDAGYRAGGLAQEEPDIRLYRQLLARTQRMSASPGANQIPNEVARVAAAEQNPLGERGLTGQSPALATTPAAWRTNAESFDKLFHERLAELRTPEQLGAVPALESTPLHQIDTTIIWMLMIVGGCLIVGLFTRLAAVVGALFLLSIVCAQPPWLANSLQTYTYNQWVEMLALFSLATTPVGRWAGLDYFLHLCFRGCCGRRSETVVVAPPASSSPSTVK